MLTLALHDRIKPHYQTLSGYISAAFHTRVSRAESCYYQLESQEEYKDILSR